MKPAPFLLALPAAILAPPPEVTPPPRTARPSAQTPVVKGRTVVPDIAAATPPRRGAPAPVVKGAFHAPAHRGMAA